MNINRPLSRRALLRFSAAQLLTMGLWPGALRAQGTSPGGRFRFLVINDIHYLSDRCGRFLERVTEKIRAGDPPELCLIAGDLTDHGTAAELGPVKDFYQRLRVPTFVVPGNHDYLTQKDRSVYDHVFPGSLNYFFKHRGWQFVALDTTEGLKASKTNVQPSTLDWIKENLPQLDKLKPLVIFTHFPLGEQVANRPVNADAVLEPFRDHNLRAVFSGHYHASTERTAGQVVLVTNRCCSISKTNHDKSTEKGYFLCEANEGAVTRQFVEVETKGVS